MAREAASAAASPPAGSPGMIVDMLEAGLFRTLLDVQCFDLRAVESFRRNAGPPGRCRLRCTPTRTTGAPSSTSSTR